MFEHKKPEFLANSKIKKFLYLLYNGKMIHDAIEIIQGFHETVDSLAQQFRGFARNDFFAQNSASFSYQYETSFAQNCTFIRNK